VIPEPAWAQGAAPAGGAAGGLVSLIPFVAMFFIFYFLIIRPQQKRQKEHQKLLDSLEKGHRVATSGGMLGTVVGVKGDRVVLKIAENVKAEFLKSTVTAVLAEKGDPIE
jgi:preprotein translocase subunit YajC